MKCPGLALLLCACSSTHTRIGIETSLQPAHLEAKQHQGKREVVAAPPEPPKQVPLTAQEQFELEVQLVAAKCELTSDPFEQSTWLHGPSEGGGLLRWHKDTGSLQLYAVGDFFNDTAADDSGERFHVIEIGRPWSGAAAIRLSPEYLQDRAETGIRVKFWGGKRDAVVELPPAYILGFALALHRAVADPLPNDNVEPIELTSRPPLHPHDARLKEGAVTCRLHISEAGEVTGVDVVASSGHERLDAAAREAYGKWRFAPRRVQGKAVASTVERTASFKLSAAARRDAELLERLNSHRRDWP